jgi:hypothetical protein
MFGSDAARLNGPGHSSTRRSILEVTVCISLHDAIPLYLTVLLYLGNLKQSEVINIYPDP